MPISGLVTTLLTFLLSVTTTCVSADEGGIPSWLGLRVGQHGYVDGGYATFTVLCRSFDSYVKWIQHRSSSGACFRASGGAYVIVTGWKLYSIGPSFSEPIIQVRQKDDLKQGWTMAVVPVIPAGAEVLIGGAACKGQLALEHQNLSDYSTTRLACRAKVVKQVVTSGENVVLVRFLKSGVETASRLDNAVLLDVTLPNGLPRYSLGHLVL